MAPEVLSLLGVAQIKETIESVRGYYNPRLQVLGILLNRYSARFNLNREVLEMAGRLPPSWRPGSLMRKSGAALPRRRLRPMG